MNGIEVARQLDAIPNLPYFPTLISKEIRNLLSEIPEVTVKEDNYAIYVQYRRGPEQPKIIFDTHLDHPGFVVKNHTQAVGLGSLQRTETVAGIEEEQQYSVSYVLPNGETIATGQLTDFRFKQGRTSAIPRVESQPKLKLPSNTLVVPILDTLFFGGKIRMRSADNLITSGLLIELLQKLSSQQEDANIEVIFSKLEEIRQITATGIARRGSTPFGKITEKDMLVVLEVGPFMAKGEVKTQGGLAIVNSERNLKYQVGQQQNLAESLVMSACMDLGIHYVETGVLSHSDAAPHIVFGTTPNIITVGIESENRHNVDPNGYLTTENISSKSLQELARLIEYLSTQSRNIISANKNNSAKMPIQNSEAELRKQKHALLSSLLWAEPRLEKEKLFPDSLVTTAYFLFNSALTRVRRI